MFSLKLQRYSFFFMVLMVSLFNYSDNSILKLITNLSVVAFIFIIFAVSLGKIRIPPALKYLSLFFVFCLVSVFFSTAFDDSVSKTKTLFILVFEFTAVYHYVCEENEADKALSSVALCTVITSVYILLRSFVLLQSTKRVNGVTGDSNQVSAYLVYGIVVLIYTMHTKKLSRFVSALGIASAFLSIILQGSRTAVVVAIFTAVLEAFLITGYEKTPFSKKFRVLTFTAIILVAGVCYIMTNPVAYMALGSRLASFYQILTTGSSSIKEQSMFSRMTAYRLAFERFLENPVFGRGIGSFAGFSEQSVLRRYGFCPDNYLELMQGIGIFGTLFYYAVYFSIFKKAGKAFRKRDDVSCVFVICIIVAMLLEHITVVFYYHKLEYLFLGVILAFCTVNEKRGGEKAPNFSDTVFDFVKAFKLLWNKKVTIVSVTLLCAFVFTMYAKLFVTPMYSTDVLMYVNNSAFTVSSFSDAEELAEARELADTYIAVLKSKKLLSRIAENTGLSYSDDELSDMISAYRVNETEIIKVVITSKEKEEAKLIADAVAEALPKMLTNTIAGSGAEVIDYAVEPEKKSSPDLMKYGKTGLNVGGFVMCVYFIIKARRNDLIHGEKTLREEFGDIPVLAVIENKDRK